MLGILRGSLVTQICSIAGDFSTDAKTKIRRKINEQGPPFCQLRDWPFLHTTVTFNITDGTYEYAGSGYLPQGFQRFLALKLKDSNNDYVPIDEKPLSWYDDIQDPAFEGQPYAVVLRGLDSSGYPKAFFYYCPDATYTFEADCTLNFTDVDESSSGDTTRVIITADCYAAFSHFVAMAYAVEQGDDGLIARCERILYGDRIQRIPGLLGVLFSKQRGSGKKRQATPDSSYKQGKYITSSDYGRHIP